MAVLLLASPQGDLAHAQTATERIEYAENGTAPVVAYTAVDPEGSGIVWQLTGTDAGSFSLESGVLAFNSPPDYETPPDGNTDNEYEVTVTASDGSGNGEMLEVTVVVTNVDEPGTVTVPTQQPQEEVALTVSLTDPDGDVTDTTWQWARSQDGSTGWVDIEGATAANYIPNPADVGTYLRATASYTDGEGKWKSAYMKAANPVQGKLYVNAPPVFRDAAGEPITQSPGIVRFLAEDASTGDPVGDPVAASDNVRDTLTYSLGGTDASAFEIDSGTGQIKVGAGTALNFEGKKKSYSVTVIAKDPIGAMAMLDVTITVTDVDEAPTITAGDTVEDYAETRTDKVGDVNYAATDPEDDTNVPQKVLKWSVSGPDASKFKIGNTDSDRGQLDFKAQPDYEASASADGDNIYEVKVVVTDSDGMTDSRDVIVRVTNENEPGTVTLSNLQPEVGVPLMAELEDPDGVIGTVEWQWQSGNVDIDGATSPTFEPTSSHENQTLTAKAMYADGHGADKMAEVDSANQVQAHDTNNKLPAFESRNLARQVADGTVGDSTDGEDNVGAPVVAEDVDDQDQVDDANLTYSLDSGTDARSFTIHRGSGQIRVADGVTIDYETKRSYTVTVTATDPSRASATARVTITVTQMDEPPVISGDDPGVYAENGTGRVADYNAVDPERERVVWTLDGDDVGDFSISSAGVLTFNATPDYENPVDDDTDNTYEVTVEASDAGSLKSTREITVTVTNVDEDGTISLTARQPKVGVDLTASLTDPDGTPGPSPPITVTEITPRSWQWARSTSASGPWTVISGQATASYAPAMGDVGSYLRVTARYDDGEGKYKIAHEVSDNAVEAAVAVNRKPVFVDANGEMIPDGEGITINVAEDTTAGMNVGAPVVASDADNDKLTYTLGTGDDNSSFAIDSGTGQIKVGAATTPNFEGAKITYTLEVIAADPSDTQGDASRDSIGVTINVTNVDEDPSLTGTSALFHAETAEVTTALATYMATDDEDGADLLEKALKWSLAGTDAAKFTLSINADRDGELKFNAKPDYENPTDTGSNNAYDVTVEVTDSDGNTASKDVAITVTNEDEDGEVTFSSLQPQDGIVLTATLRDRDGSTSGITWAWQRSDTSQQVCSAVGDSNWVDIQVANPRSPSYTPVKADEERCLRATASYTDGEGAGKSAPGVTANWVQAADTNNLPPEFPDQDDQTSGKQNEEAEISVDENTTGNVGDPVAAESDTDGVDGRTGEVLTYTLGGTDAGSFDIDPATAQISVGAGTTLDFETNSTYSVTVTATDPSGPPATATIKVTIKVNNVDEAPAISKKALAIGGRRSIDHPEDGQFPVATYTAAGPEAARVTWSLAGTDSGDFSITGGVLAFRASPNYESPVDSDRDNEYRVTVRARDSGGNTAARDVTVRVANVDEDGAVTLSPSTADAGVEITATLTDVDGVTAGTVSWQWARSPNGASNWADIASATSNAYTPGNADADNYLRATASYTDGHGPGKSENAISANAVGGNTPPEFPASETGARSVHEGATVGTDIGAPVAAQDPGDTLTYTLGGTDAASFDIVEATGQLQTRVALDAATKSSYTVTVTATDTLGATDTITVTITVTVRRVQPWGPLGDRYDANNNGMIDKPELITAINDYLFSEGVIDKRQLIQIINLYLFGP